MTEHVETGQSEKSAKRWSWWAAFWQSNCCLKFCAFCKALYATIKVLATVAGLVAFVALYLSIQQFDAQQRNALKDATQARLNQIMALRNEMQANLATCNSVLSTKDSYVTGDSVLYAVFLHAALGEVLRTGAIDDRLLQSVNVENPDSISVSERQFNVTLMNCYARLLLSNMLIDNCIDLDIAAATAELEVPRLVEVFSKHKRLGWHLVEDVEYVKKRLQMCLPEFVKIESKQRSVLDSLIAAEDRDWWSGTW